MVVNEHDAWNFAYVLPPEHPPGDEPELVIPDALQMGWSESPAFFCAATETAHDLAEKSLVTNAFQKPHPMESPVLNIDWSKLPDTATVSTKTFLWLLEVYIDDFIALIQSTNIDDITYFTRYLLHAITICSPL